MKEEKELSKFEQLLKIPIKLLCMTEVGNITYIIQAKINFIIILN